MSSTTNSFKISLQLMNIKSKPTQSQKVPANEREKKSSAHHQNIPKCFALGTFMYIQYICTFNVKTHPPPLTLITSYDLVAQNPETNLRNLPRVLFSHGGSHQVQERQG